MKKLFQYIAELLRPLFRKIVGWNEIDEQFSTLRYLFNQYFDITAFPKATGILRQCQLADTELLRLVHEILQKHNLPYWLDYGTLLGAVRHKGFIPWDDDLDICMTREHYDIASEILPEELKKYNISMTKKNPERIGISIWEAGLILDIFPVDNVDAVSIKDFEDLRNRTIEYRKYYVKNKSKSASELTKVKDRIIGAESRDNPVWYHNAEFCADRTVYSDETIFPLRKIEFEAYEFFAPNDCHTYLKETYGDYMSFPKGGMLHHKGGNNISIIENSIKHKVNMDEFLEEMKQYKVQ